MARVPTDEFASQLQEVTRRVLGQKPPDLGTPFNFPRGGQNAQFVRVTGAGTATGGITYYPCRLRLKNPTTGVWADASPAVDLWLENVLSSDLVTDGTGIYLAKQLRDAWAVTDTGTITAASNAAPIVITSTAHGLSTGDVETIAGVLGNTAANGTWTITVIDADHYSLNGSTGNGAYTSGGSASRTRTRALFVTVTADCSTAAGDFPTEDETQTQPTTKFLVSDPTLGTRNINAQDLGKIINKEEGVVTATFGATTTFNLHAGRRQQVTLTGNSIYALSGEYANALFTIRSAQDPTGGRSVTWFSGIIPPFGVMPPVAPLANMVTQHTFERIGAGSYRCTGVSYWMS